MEWTSEAIILSAKPYGESDALVEAFSEEKGLARGFIKGGLGRRQRSLIQQGNRVALTWRARDENNLGRFNLELIHSPLGGIIGDGARLLALQSVLVVCQSVLQEQVKETEIYQAFTATLSLVENQSSSLPLWGAALARLELMLLNKSGFGLDLTVCAATGVSDDLIYVSPKSGRAVSAAAGKPYHNKLLKLPSFMRLPGLGNVSQIEALAALETTGFFLSKEIWAVRSRHMPEARSRFLRHLAS